MYRFGGIGPYRVRMLKRKSGPAFGKRLHGTDLHSVEIGTVSKITISSLHLSMLLHAL